jgi:hypothetical protein
LGAFLPPSAIADIEVRYDIDNPKVYWQKGVVAYIARQYDIDNNQWPFALSVAVRRGARFEEIS